MAFHHVPIMLEACVDGLKIKPNGIYVDGTLGGAGHGYHVASRLVDGGRFIGIDQDASAIKASEERLKPFLDRVTLVRENYVHMQQVLQVLGIEKVDGILLDLGVSSHQLDEASRGFSYMQEGPLDMRMDDRQTLTAATIVNTYSHSDLARLIKNYGEERYALKIATLILKERAIAPITTTTQLAAIIKRAIPAKSAMTGGHPAKRTFQAIRIALNQELSVLETALDHMMSLLNPGGRLCIITFHSLEDRIVKHRFRAAQYPCTCPPDFPMCVCGKTPLGHVVTNKPILPTQEELSDNKRAQSAKLRVFESI